MTFFNKFIINALSAFLIVSGLLVVNIPAASAQGLNLIICGEDKDGNKILDKSEECDFYDLVQLAKNFINALIIISTFIATGVFAYAGLRLITSGGNSSDKEYAKGVFIRVGKGYLWILAAWLIVYTITNVLLDKEYRFLLGDPGAN